MPRAILNTICEWLFQAWWAPSKNSSKMLHVMSATPTLFYCRPQPFTNPNSPASSIMSPLQPSPMPRGVISPRIVSHAHLLIMHFSYYHIQDGPAYPHGNNLMTPSPFMADVSLAPPTLIVIHAHFLLQSPDIGSSYGSPAPNHIPQMQMPPHPQANLIDNFEDLIVEDSFS